MGGGGVIGLQLLLLWGRLLVQTSETAIAAPTKPTDPQGREASDAKLSFILFSYLNTGNCHGCLATLKHFIRKCVA